MRRFGSPRLSTEQAREWLTARVGFMRARDLCRAEARALGVDPDSDTALRHAIATYCATSGDSPAKNPLTTNQEGLIP